MNTIRMIAIALPMTLLLACGGGGGGGGTAVAPTTNPPTGGPNMPLPVTLPGYAINLATARTAVGGTAPTGNMTETQIVSEIQTRATAADTFEFSDFVGMPNVDMSCTNNSSCSGTVPDVGALTFFLTDIEDLSLVDDTGLMDFIAESEVVMEDRGVTMIQSQAAARQEDGTRLSFQAYGGWLTDSVFGLEFLDVTENATTTRRFASFSFGEETGSNPTGQAQTNWDGVMVGALIGTGDIVQGDARLSVNLRSTSSDGTIGFSNIKNLNTGSNVPDIQPHILAFTDGSLNLSGGRGGLTVKGSFYGDNNEEIGGVFSTTDLHGAFGATRQ